MPHVGRWRIHLVWHAEPFARPFDRGRRIPAFCILLNPGLFVLPSLTVTGARALRSGYQPSSLLSPIPAARDPSRISEARCSPPSGSLRGERLRSRVVASGEAASASGLGVDSKGSLGFDRKLFAPALRGEVVAEGCGLLFAWCR